MPLVVYLDYIGLPSYFLFFFIFIFIWGQKRFILRSSQTAVNSFNSIHGNVVVAVGVKNQNVTSLHVSVVLLHMTSYLEYIYILKKLKSNTCGTWQTPIWEKFDSCLIRLHYSRILDNATSISYFKRYMLRHRVFIFMYLIIITTSKYFMP